MQIHPIPPQARQVMQSDTLEIYYYQDVQDYQVDLHHHDFYEIYLFLSGNVTYSIESRSYKLEHGDILLISPFELHQPIIHYSGQPYERIILWVSKGFLDFLNREDLNLTACFNDAFTQKTNLLRLEPKDRTRFIETMCLLLQENKSNSAFGSQLLQFSYLAQLIVMLNRYSQQQLIAYQPEDKTAEMIGEVVAYINEHYAIDLGLDHLANRFFISKYYLSHEFQRCVGTSVYRYIIQKRLMHARYMMMSGNAPTKIFQKCGFKDYSAFYRAFKQEYNSTPKEYASRIAFGMHLSAVTWE
ncbi:MAG: AraC family transcriptional regulator [Erysipelotrichaceae bacterium]